MKKNTLSHFIAEYLTLIILVSLSLFAMNTVTVNGAREGLAEVQLSKMTSELQTYGNNIEYRAKLMRGTLTSLSKEPSVLTPRPEECSRYLKETLPSVDTIFDTLTRSNLDGYFDCSTTASTVGIKARNTKFAYMDQIFDDPKHEAVLGRLIYYRQDGKTIPFMAMHVPLVDDGEFKGTIGTALYMDDLMSKKFDVSKSFSRAAFIMIDDNNDLLYEAGIDQDVISMKDSRTMSPRFKTLTEMVLSGENTQGAIREGDQFYIFEKIEVFPGRSWILAANISQQDLILSTNLSSLGMRIIKASSFERLVTTVLLAIVGCLVMTLVLRGVNRLYRDES